MLKKYVKNVYVAFDPQEATFLFERNIKLESKETLFSQIPAMVRHLYFPKKRIKLLIGLLVAWPLYFLVIAFFFWPSKISLQGLVILSFVIIGLVISIISHYFAIFSEIRRLKNYTTI
ncbi:hypothetical protein BGI32_10655 [Snodgrassella alvi]|uniref:Uncharacterized protein n=1 Tax=Snodgrassella alvi TaxID=1196083 RepID=A0A2N9WR99_9NEIS|nr:hypothetical protein [Snodgrassella alvi]PIT12388.1 hypothetical protein BGI32_10655 [Snodgrassella alvi]